MESTLKRELRREGRARRRAYQGEARAHTESLICDHILAAESTQSVLRRGLLLGAYLAFDGEVNLSGLWGGTQTPLWSESGESDVLSQHLVFPRHESGRPLTFVRAERWAGAGPLLIPEGREVAREKIGMLLVPGVLFHPQGHARIGLGGGHYDRTLALRSESAWSVVAFGVGFTLQLTPHLPVDPWDAPLDGMFTERGLIT